MTAQDVATSAIVGLVSIRVDAAVVILWHYVRQYRDRKRGGHNA